jgi:hypothetical protein
MIFEINIFVKVTICFNLFYTNKKIIFNLLLHVWKLVFFPLQIIKYSPLLFIYYLMSNAIQLPQTLIY